MCIFVVNGFVGWVLIVSARVWSAEIKDPKECREYPCLIFHEEFNKFDLSTWEHLKTAGNTGNNEFQYYTNNRSNSFVRKGVLYLKPTLTNDTFDDEFLFTGNLDLWGSSDASYCTANRRNYGCFKRGLNNSIINPIQSSAVRTARRFSFKYGKVEVKAKLPQGDWIWPAVWLLPRYYVYGRWPASGEIDLFESRGNGNLKSVQNGFDWFVGNQMVSQTLHWGPNFRADSFLKTSATTNKNKGSFADGFHLYGLEWSQDKIIFSIDKKITLNITIGEGGFWKLGNFENYFPNVSNPWKMGTKMAPFDQEFYIVMNVAVGGTNEYFNDNLIPKPPWDNNSMRTKAMKEFWKARDKWLLTWQGNKVAMKVDYVKVWSNGIT